MEKRELIEKLKKGLTNEKLLDILFVVLFANPAGTEFMNDTT